ncbi:MAG: histidine phosphatase family protein [Pseudomonadota bacterium]
MAKLYLIRHAQSANNVLWNGVDEDDGRNPDPEITALGHQQAEALGDHLAHPESEPRQHPFAPVQQTHFGLTHIYCSLMSRSILTAEYIASACHLDLQALPDIYERHGIYQVDESGTRQGVSGPGKEYFEDRFPGVSLPENMDPEGWWNRPAESDDMFLNRMQQVVAETRQRLTDSDDCIAMVVHGDFIDQFINELMGVDRHSHNYANHWVANWTFHNTSISRIDFVDGSHNVVYLNRIDHLPADRVSW